MVFSCDICESQNATAYCFAHKQSLCPGCDVKLHAGAKPGQKHERVALTPLQEQTQCDICQEHPAVMFCSEDRALICRRCDLMIHTANQFTKTHHRYILSGTAAGLHGLPEPAASGSSSAETTATLHRSAASQMPRIQPSSSSGDLLNMPRMPAGAVFMGAPAEVPAAVPMAVPTAGAAAGEAGSVAGGSRDDAGGASAAAGDGASGSGGADRATSVTLASDLLGMPTLPENYSAKDVDAVWGDAGLGDLDDWSRFLEVPDLGFLPDDAATDLFGFGGASQPADSTVFDDPVVSVRDPGLLTSAVPAAVPAAAAAAAAAPAVKTPAAAVVANGRAEALGPEVPSLKRPRVG